MSMRDYLDPRDTEGEIRLELHHSSAEDKVWIIVEGQDDFKLYRKLFAGTVAVVEVVTDGVSGVNDLLACVKNLRELSDRIIGIRDADFLRIEEDPVDDGIFLTDCHDSEMMAVSNDDVFSATLLEYLPGKYDQYESIREQLVGSLSFLSHVRLINQKEGLGIKFKNLPLGHFYSAEGVNLNQEACVDLLQKKSQNVEIPVEQVESLMRNDFDLFELTNGHDFCRAFAMFCNHPVNQNFTENDVSAGLRQAFSKECFKSTNLYDELSEWAGTAGRVLFNN